MKNSDFGETSASPLESPGRTGGLTAPATVWTPDTLPPGPLSVLPKNSRLLYDFVLRDLKVRYIGSVIGFYWSVLNPLLLLAVYWVIFSVVIGVRFEGSYGGANFPLYVFAGLSVWVFFQESLLRATNSLIENAALVKRNVFPSEIMPVHLVCSGFVNLLVALAVLEVVALACGAPLTFSLVFLVPVLVGLFLFAAGLALPFSCFQVYFRDTHQLLSVLLLVWMYSTPIFYPADIVPSSLDLAIAVNPLAQSIQALRTIMLEGGSPSMYSVMYPLVLGLVFLLGGSWVFRRFRMNVPDLL